MTRHRILGTGGHIDHGKTTLVKALTGTDTDRLPEEKRRGITIDLGFARLDLPGVTFGVVDVPGHEKFVKNMLAGAAAIDVALLVIDANEGVMPQTREHAAIFRLLGVRAVVAAITKCDAADGGRILATRLAVSELLAAADSTGAEIVEVSAATGQGIDALRQALVAATGTVREPADTPFRMAIDRVFTPAGFGTVVTGSVVSGAAAIGDELDWHAEGTVRTVRIRGLNRHGEGVDRVTRGMRAAVNLPGIPAADVGRGQELATPGTLVPTRLLSVKLFAVGDGTIRHRLTALVHIGTGEVGGTVSVLDGDAARPGRPVLAQIALDRPVVATWGQSFVVRSPAADATLGGGVVLQPNAVRIRRRAFDSLLRLEELAAAEPHTRLRAAVWFCGTRFYPRRTAGATVEDLGALVESGTVVERNGTLLHRDRIAEATERLTAALGRAHLAQPLATGFDRGRITASAGFSVDDAAPDAAFEHEVAAGNIVAEGRRVSLAAIKPKLTANQRRMKEQFVAELRAAGVNPPDVSSLEPRARGVGATARGILAVAAAEGDVVDLGELFVSAETEALLRRKVLNSLAGGTGLTVAAIRDLLQTTRKLAIPLCEYFDRVGVTRRAGDLRYAGGNEKPPADSAGGV